MQITLNDSINSAEEFGFHNISLIQSVQPIGIASEETFGSFIIGNILWINSIDSNEGHGNHWVVNHGDKSRIKIFARHRNYKYNFDR